MEGLADDFPGTGSLPLAETEGDDVGAGGVDDERGVPEPVDGVEQ